MDSLPSCADLNQGWPLSDFIPRNHEIAQFEWGPISLQGHVESSQDRPPPHRLLPAETVQELAYWRPEARLDSAASSRLGSRTAPERRPVRLGGSNRPAVWEVPMKAKRRRTSERPLAIGQEHGGRCTAEEVIWLCGFSFEGVFR